MTSFEDLRTGRRTVYVATRLYDIQSKRAGAELERAVIAGLADAALELRTDLPHWPTYLPFRDTAQDVPDMVLGGEESDRARRIFAADVERLSQSFALVTYLNDPSKDDGICVEIGIAFARGTPIFLVVTDFIAYASMSSPGLHFALDPVIMRMAGKVLRMPGIDPPTVPIPRHATYSLMAAVSEDYAQRLASTQRQVNTEVRKTIKQLALDTGRFTRKLPGFAKSVRGPHVFIDFAGGSSEQDRAAGRYLVGALSDLGIGARLGQRHDPDHQAQVIATNPSTEVTEILGDTDLTQALSADLVVIDGDGAEVDAGSAALLGTAMAIGKPIVLYYSDNVSTTASGRDATARNLMVLHSADRLIRKLEDIPSNIVDLLKGVTGHATDR